MIPMETPSNRLHDWVMAQGEIGGGHDRCRTQSRHVGIGNQMFRTHVLGDPLPSTGRALGQLPLIAEHHLEIALIPLGGVGFPGPFNAAGDRVFRLATPVGVRPAQSLALQRCRLRFRPQVAGGRSAVTFAEGVAACDQGHRFLHGHAHAGEGVPHISARGHRVGVAMGPLGIDVNQAHLNRR